MLKRAVAAMVASLLPMVSASAEDIRIECELIEVFDVEAGDIEADTGSATFVISRHADGTTTYAVPFACIDGTLSAAITESEISFRCDQEIGAYLAEHSVRIDRASGKYENGFGAKGQSAGMIHYGQCTLPAGQF